MKCVGQYHSTTVELWYFFFMVPVPSRSRYYRGTAIPQRPQYYHTVLGHLCEDFYAKKKHFIDWVKWWWCVCVFCFEWPKKVRTLGVLFIHDHTGWSKKADIHTVSRVSAFFGPSCILLKSALKEVWKAVEGFEQGNKCIHHEGLYAWILRALLWLCGMSSALSRISPRVGLGLVLV